MDKSAWISVTDPAEATELLERKGEIDTPTLYAPNGLLWAVAEEYRAWRQARAEGMVVISGYPSALYERLYADWQRRDCDAMAARGKPVTEVLWFNEACSKAQRQRRLIA